MDTFNSIVGNVLRPLASPPLSYALIIIVSLYAAGLRQQNATLDTLFLNPAFRILVLFLILWTSNKDPAISILTTLALVVGLNLWSGRSFLEFFQGDEYAVTAVLPTCLNVTAKDLLASFGGDAEKLVKAMAQVGVPPNVQVNDDYAPLIATYLVYFLGMNVVSACGPPPA